MYLSDVDIKKLWPTLHLDCPDPEHPFDEDGQLQPCSIDLRLSDQFWRPSRRQLWVRRLLRHDTSVDLRRSHLHSIDSLRGWKSFTLREGESYTIKPGKIVMARVYERFQVPEGYAGKIEGRSSFARLGLSVHCTGDFINPGWDGFMPLQLFNAGPYPLRIVPFFPVCQLMIIQLSSTPDRSYGHESLSSKYVGDDGGPSRWWREGQIRRLQGRLQDANVAEAVCNEIATQALNAGTSVIERLYQFVDHRQVRQLTNTNEVMQSFARREFNRKTIDSVAMVLPGILVAGIAGVAIAKLWVLTVIVGVVTVLSLVGALAAYVRRDGGYLTERELVTPERPD